MEIKHLTKAEFDREIQAAPLALVDFWAAWCSPCSQLGPIIETLAQEYEGRLLVGKVNADEEIDLMNRYDILSIPTVLLFKNGELVEKKAGVRPHYILAQMIEDNL